MNKWALSTTVFVCGASTMILELTGSRIMAPYVGTSIYVWTNLIGVILAFLSLGYAWGGKMADRWPNERLFSLIIFLAALWVALIGFLYDPVLAFIQGAIRDIRIAALAGAAILFAVPSVLLGMVLPYAVKLKVHSLDRTGAAVGDLYALSTIGSIAGTFLAGFVLLSYFGNTMVLFVLSACLVVASLTASLYRSKAKILVLAVLAVLSASSDLLAQVVHGKDLVDVNTPYSRVWIYDVLGQRGLIKVMQINDEISSVKLSGSDELIAPYTGYYRLCGHFYPGLKNVLMLGGAGYSYPKDFLAKFPHAQMDVVEIDPGVTALAKKYFGLEDDPRLTIYHEDGRTFLNRNSKTYNVVFCDVFKSSSIPFQMTTESAARRIYNALDQEGVFIGNVISSIEGDNAQFLRAQVATLKKFFSQVYIFPVQKRANAGFVQNIIIVACKSSRTPKFYSRDPEIHEYLQHLWIEPIQSLELPLTDDFAPVERYSFAALDSMRRWANPVLEHWKKMLGLVDSNR